MEITIAQLNKLVMEARLAGRTQAQLERVLMDLARSVLGDVKNLLNVAVMLKGAIAWAKGGRVFDISRRGWYEQYGVSRRACMAGDQVLSALGFRVGQKKRRGRVRTVYQLVDPGRFMAAFEAALYGDAEQDSAVHNPPDAVHNPPDAVHSAPQPIVKSSPAAVHSPPDITRLYADGNLTDTDGLPAALQPGIHDDDWCAAYHQLELQLDRASFDTWLRRAGLLERDGDVFRVGVHNEIAQQMCEHRLGKTIRSVLRDVVGRPVSVSFVVQDMGQQAVVQPPEPLFKRIARAQQAGVGD